jgi:hypothetical protein
MRFIDVDFKQREYDGKWEMIAKVMDHENAYTYKTESGNSVTLTPERWITVGVYDYLMSIED